jgi:hypothetical protein
MELAPPQRTAKHGVRMHEPSLSLGGPGAQVHAGDRAGLVSRHGRRGQGSIPHPFGNESCKYGIHRSVPGVNL